jgi:hypothetical protein
MYYLSLAVAQLRSARETPHPYYREQHVRLAEGWIAFGRRDRGFGQAPVSKPGTRQRLWL